MNNLMNSENNKPNCYKLLRDAFKRETGIKFPECLKYIEFDRYSNDYDKCICGVKIIHKFHYIFEKEGRTESLIIGSECSDNIIKDQELYNNGNKEIFDHWLKQVEKARDAYNRKNKKCKACYKPWDKPRCFLNGLCKDCQNIKKNIGNMICTMRLYDGYKIKDIYKENKEYILFCAGKDTKQTEEFKQYLKYC